jgi:hypothetical protein
MGPRAGVDDMEKLTIVTLQEPNSDPSISKYMDSSRKRQDPSESVPFIIQSTS